jgi:hypothetical protein
MPIIFNIKTNLSLATLILAPQLLSLPQEKKTKCSQPQFKCHLCQMFIRSMSVALSFHKMWTLHELTSIPDNVP